MVVKPAFSYPWLLTLKPVEVVSRPDYFEKAVVPHLQNHGKEAMDPVDSAAKAIVKELFPGKKAVFDYGRNLGSMTRFP